MIEEVCNIIGHHHDPNSEETINFRIVYDADQIVNMEESYKESSIGNDSSNKMYGRRTIWDAKESFSRSVFCLS